MKTMPFCHAGQLQLVSSGQCVTASDALIDAAVSLRTIIYMTQQAALPLCMCALASVDNWVLFAHLCCTMFTGTLMKPTQLSIQAPKESRALKWSRVMCRGMTTGCQNLQHAKAAAHLTCLCGPCLQHHPHDQLQLHYPAPFFAQPFFCSVHCNLITIINLFCGVRL